MDPADYWNSRYSAGGTSGAGSYGEDAAWKAATVNAIVADNAVESVLEFGCGDGHQLSLLKVPEYVGLDISDEAVRLCRERHRTDPTKSFRTWTPGAPVHQGPFDLVLALEVLMHIIDDDAFCQTLDAIFASSRRLVVIQTPLAPVSEYRQGSHEHHRDLLPYLAPHLASFDLT
ncbi:MAG: class I SAM-dependent methyltransferase, partial [Thermoleophilia bacterium]